jgi:single-stranded DNA-binding protein
MSTFALLSGKLQSAAQQRTSRNGNAFAMATLRVIAGNEVQFWRLFVFSKSAQAELMRLNEGDALAAQGSLKIEPYEHDGVTKVGLTIIADAILPLRRAPKQRAEKATAPHPPRHEKPPPDRDRLDRHGDQGPDVFGDKMPF